MVVLGGGAISYERGTPVKEKRRVRRIPMLTRDSSGDWLWGDCIKPEGPKGPKGIRHVLLY